MADDFAVLGDLRDSRDNGVRRESGRFIVRMFVGDDTFDEEIDCSLDDLRGVVQKRIAALSKKPVAKLKVDAKRPHPSLDNGHAVEVP